MRHNYTWKRYYLTVVAVLAAFKSRQDCDGSVLERSVAVSLSVAVPLIPIQGVVLITLDAVQKPSNNLENCDVQIGAIQIIFMVYSEPNFFSNIWMLQIKLFFRFMRNGLLLFLFMFAWREVSLFGTQIVSWRWMLMGRPFIFLLHNLLNTLSFSQGGTVHFYCHEWCKYTVSAIQWSKGLVY